MARRDETHASVERMKDEHLRGPLIAGVASVVEELRPWLRLERELDDSITRMRVTFARFGILSRISDAGALDRVSVRILEKSFQRQDGTVGSRKVEDKRILGRTHGVAVLRMPKNKLLSAAGRLSCITRAAEKSAITDAEAEQLARFRSEAIEDMESGVRRFELAKAFFTPKNVEEFERWLQAEDPTAPGVMFDGADSGRGLLVEEGTGGLPVAILVPNLDEIPTRETLIEPLLRHGAVAA